MNTSTKIWIVILCTQLLTVSAAVLTVLADMWLTEGTGVNPWIALPIATLFMGLPYLMADLFSDDVEDELLVRRLNKVPDCNRIDDGSTDFPKDRF